MPNLNSLDHIVQDLRCQFCDSNRLVSTTDAAGAVTTYSYNADTNVLEWVKYPNNDDSTRTNYEYDDMFRVKKVTASTGLKTLSAQYTYTKDQLTRLLGKSVDYTFSYSNFGLLEKINMGTERLLATYTYESGTNLLKTLDYGNDDSVQYTYDDVGRLIRESYTDETNASTGTVDYGYDNDGGLATVTDSATGIKTTYFYDFVDRLESYNQKIGDNTILKLEYGYDLENRLTSETWYFPGSNAYVNSYTYNSDGTVQGMGSGVMGTGYSYDGLGRLTQIDSEIAVSKRQYTYRTEGAVTTSQVTKLNYPNLLGDYTFEYTYDVAGNIASYATGYTSDGIRITDSTEYTYDAQNQLIRAEGSKTYTYTYNSGGNLVTAFDGTTTHTYSYYAGSWGDLLHYYDQEEIIYDWMGNPTSYYNGTRWNFTWQNGRELTTASKTGTSVSYTYDADGMRKTKTVNGVPHTYYYNGGTLLREVYGDTILDFFYNANGTPIAMRQSAVGSTNYTIYYYITNLQGDVIRLVDHLGQTAAYYRYDPYGKVIEASGSHANINPLRYRGYYYDVETGLYYLQSRYYDPQVGRFLIPDTIYDYDAGLQGYNLFAYCGNNPVNRIDCSGADSLQLNEELDPVEVEEETPKGGLTSGGNNTSTSDISNQLSRCASNANSRVPGRGPVVGTQKHIEFANEVNNLNNPNLQTEVSYSNGEIVSYGTKGSIRFDVVLYDASGAPIAAWDFKTGSATLSNSRIGQMQTRSGLGIDIHVVR